jgi:hypothetical protein
VIKVDSLGVPGAGFNITIAVVRTVSEDVYDDLGASSFVTNLETRAEEALCREMFRALALVTCLACSSRANPVFEKVSSWSQLESLFQFF